MKIKCIVFGEGLEYLFVDENKDRQPICSITFHEGIADMDLSHFLMLAKEAIEHRHKIDKEKETNEVS